MLCAICRNVFGRVGSQTNSSHHATLDALQQAAEIGCYLCTSVYEDLCRFTSQELERIRNIKPLLKAFLHNWDEWEGKRTARLTIASVHQGDLNYESCYYLYPFPCGNGLEFQLQAPDQDCSSAWHTSYPKIRNNTGAPEVNRLAHSWLQICLDSHSNCGLVSGPFTYPPRLLDVSFSEPRLVCGKSLAPLTAPYAALSHCWGPDPTFLTLTGASLDRFMLEGITDAELPMNFRNAIQICRWLHIRYIWIDSLCIIQSGPGAKEDWLHHVNTMRDIYSQCQVCISASCATSAIETCFRNRNPRHVYPFAMKLDSATLRLHPEGTPHILIPRNLVRNDHPRAPLAFRGWAFQERMLSPRILIFGQKQIFWECRETELNVICETLPVGVSRDVSRFVPTEPFMLPLQEEPGVNDERSARWKALIGLYSRCQLTRIDEDKLVAFEGLAQYMSIVFADPVYIAGFFRHELPQSLVWAVRKQQIPRYRPKKGVIYRAPSWSWAATNSEVYCHGTNASKRTKIIAKLISFIVIPMESSNPFGQLKHAELTIRAPVSPMSWDLSNGPNDAVFLVPAITDKEIRTVEHATHNFDSEEDFLGPQENVACIPILEQPRRTIVFALIVKRVDQGENATRGCYMRIGVLAIWGKDRYNFLGSMEEEEITLV